MYEIPKFWLFLLGSTKFLTWSQRHKNSPGNRWLWAPSAHLITLIINDFPSELPPNCFVEGWFDFIIFCATDSKRFPGGLHADSRIHSLLIIMISCAWPSGCLFATTPRGQWGHLLKESSEDVLHHLIHFLRTNSELEMITSSFSLTNSHISNGKYVSSAFLPFSL